MNDRVDTPVRPATRVVDGVYFYDGYFHRRLTRWMEMRGPGRAEDVNSLDEVPDSTWFTNRIGVRAMSVEEVRRGPNQSGTPEDHRPWTIRSCKHGGTSVGFVIKDARGIKYMLKFDQRGIPEMETAADVIVQRILWACGYNVPENQVVYFRRSDLTIAPDATTQGLRGREVPLTQELVDAQLAEVEVAPDGRIRGLASRFIEGSPIGSSSRSGVRPDDPNDVVPHERRRELRGEYAFFAWLDHTDVKDHNTLDSWVADPDRPSRHYVVHYLLDFGKALGAFAYIGREQALGHAHSYDFAHMGLSLVSLGLWRRPWEARRAPALVGVGLFDADSYDPGRWKPTTPSYFPVHDADRFDSFWAAKILVRFTRAQLDAIVAEARLGDPRARRYLVDTLVARQRKTARHWFRRVGPLDRFEIRRMADGVDRHQICFDDLALAHRLEDDAPARTRYRAAAFDREGAPTGWSASARGRGAGRACVAGFTPGDAREGYTIVRIDTWRGGRRLPGVLIHLARAPATRGLRIIGLRRL